jgi:hypothetical protein
MTIQRDTTNSDEASQAAQLALTRVVQVMRVYLDRGKQALVLSERLLAKPGGPQHESDFQPLLQALQRRDEAFHNFRALDHLAAKAGADICNDSEAVALWNVIMDINSRLAEKLNHTKIKHQSKLGQLQKVQRGLAGYHSGQKFAPKLIKTA